ncbi:hypothetical protein Gotur_011887 [Gossypium turneri]
MGSGEERKKSWGSNGGEEIKDGDVGKRTRTRLGCVGCNLEARDLNRIPSRWEKSLKCHLSGSRLDPQQIVCIAPGLEFCLSTPQSAPKIHRVLDAFIPNKRNAANKRFGFIRYAYLAEARRAIERMNDFWMYKHRLGVNLARFKCRSSFRKRKHMDKKYTIHDRYKPKEVELNVRRKILVVRSEKMMDEIVIKEVELSVRRKILVVRSEKIMDEIVIKGSDDYEVIWSDGSFGFLECEEDGVCQFFEEMFKLLQNVLNTSMMLQIQVAILWRCLVIMVMVWKKGTIYKGTQVSQKEDEESLLASQDEGGKDGDGYALIDLENMILENGSIVVMMRDKMLTRIDEKG